MIRERLQERAGNFSIVLDDVSLTHVAFSPEFTRAVEAKQVAQQTALRAAFLVDQAVQEKEVCHLDQCLEIALADVLRRVLLSVPRVKHNRPSSLETP
jgi:regulator of protease activity HflC (stomatin/prohibitin superfamily)